MSRSELAFVGQDVVIFVVIKMTVGVVVGVLTVVVEEVGPNTNQQPPLAEPKFSKEIVW